MKSRIQSTQASDEKIGNLIKLFVYCGVPPVLLVIFISVALQFINSNNTNNEYLIVFLQQSIPILIAYAVIPFILFRVLERQSAAAIGLKFNCSKVLDIIDILAVAAFLIFLAIKGVFQNTSGIWVIHYGIVAISEEILVRGLILYQLNKLLKHKWIAVVISAFIFSLVFHSTDGLLLNMIYRVPFGILTAFLYLKTDSLASSIIFHWIYDVILSI